MSKKNRYKFRQRPNAVAESTPPENVVNQTNGITIPTSPSALRDAISGAMAVHTTEYKVISNDLIRLIVINLIMLVAVLVVYFTNQNSGYLERIFQDLIR